MPAPSTPCSKNPFLLLALLAVLTSPGCTESPSPEKIIESTSTVPLWGDFPNRRPTCVRGIHLTSWYTGSKKGREKFEKLFAETELNTAVIDVKETEGDVYIPGVLLDGKPNYVPAVRDIKDYLAFLKARGIYTVARIVVFHDNHLARMKPEWAVRSSQPLSKAAEKKYRSDVWVDRNGSAWADPFNPNVWDYNIDIAMKAADLGFQEIQFDYIRFPSDGPTKFCLYSKPVSSQTKVEALGTFLSRAHKKCQARGVALSIDVFGLVGSNDDDMGIGQRLSRLTNHVDVVSPMMYPSHYAPGMFGLKHPNASPYETIYKSLSDTKKMMKNSQTQLRPYLQDFSIGGVKYTAAHVRDQINAANDLGIYEWLLWNPACRYTRDALLPNDP